MWGLSMTAWATTSAASIVISPKERLRSWTGAWQRCVQTAHFHYGQRLRGELTVTTGSPSMSTAARAMAPSERTRQSPKLTTCTFLRCLRACEVHQWQLALIRRLVWCLSPVLQCVKLGLTCAMASVPFLVNVLSLKLRTRSCGLWRKAEANAITPG